MSRLVALAWWGGGFVFCALSFLASLLVALFVSLFCFLLLLEHFKGVQEVVVIIFKIVQVLIWIVEEERSKRVVERVQHVLRSLVTIIIVVLVGLAESGGPCLTKSSSSLGGELAVVEASVDWIPHRPHVCLIACWSTVKKNIGEFSNIKNSGVKGVMVKTFQ